MSFLKKVQPTNPRDSFTLIELLIVIGIVAILSVVTVIVLNPAELLKQSRDSKRLTDLTTLNKALKIVEVDAPSASFGTNTVVYTSLADSSSTCGSWGLPALPAGYTYSCVTSANLQKTDGTGWVPVNFNLVSTGSPISSLPIDPVNSSSTGQYYTYVPGGSWEITALLESIKYATRNSVDDGDSFPGVLSIGTTHNVTPGIRDYGLVGYWKFDEGSGTAAVDSSGQGNSGTLTNGPAWATSVSCKVGGCLSFDGTNDYVTLGDLSIAEGLSSITVMAWVNASSLTGERAVVSKYSSSWLLEPVGGTLSFYVPPAAFSAGLLATGSWYFVAGVYDGSLMRLFINGSQTGSSARTGSVRSGTSPVQIGSYGSGGAPWSGYIDDVRIYNRALSAAEIQAIYNATR